MGKNNGSTFSKDEGHSSFRSFPLKNQRLQHKRRENKTRVRLRAREPSCGHIDNNERGFVNDNDDNYNSSGRPQSADPVPDDEGGL